MAKRIPNPEALDGSVRTQPRRGLKDGKLEARDSRLSLTVKGHEVFIPGKAVPLRMAKCFSLTLRLGMETFVPGQGLPILTSYRG